MLTRKAEGIQLPQQQGYQGDRSEVRRGAQGLLSRSGRKRQSIKAGVWTKFCHHANIEKTVVTRWFIGKRTTNKHMEWWSGRTSAGHMGTSTSC